MGERMGRAGAGLGFPRERVLCPALQAGPPHSQPHRTEKEPAPPCQGQPRAARSPRPASQTAVALRLSEGLMINLPPRGHGGVRCAQGAPAPPPHPSRIAPQGSTVPTALGVAQPQHTAAVRSGGLESKEPGSPPRSPTAAKNAWVLHQTRSGPAPAVFLGTPRAGSGLRGPEHRANSACVPPAPPGAAGSRGCCSPFSTLPAASRAPIVPALSAAEFREEANPFSAAEPSAISGSPQGRAAARHQGTQQGGRRQRRAKAS